LLLFAVGCDLETYVDYDSAADFTGLKTYSWMGRQHPEVSDLGHRRIIEAIDE
jgi:hypothetical protein